MNDPTINRKSHILNSFKDELGRIFIVSIGVFLFILFFQPFPLGMLDYDNRLLYVTGFGLINFLSAWIILILMPFLLPKLFKVTEWDNGPPFLTSLLLLVITAIAFAFYIRFVGKIPLSLYILFKVFLVCLLPLIIITLLYKSKSMESLIADLQEEKKYFISKLVVKEKTEEEEEFEIISENKSDKLKLKYSNVVFVKSADNYIEVYFLENNQLEKALVRNTLKSIESQLANHKNFIRCHRTSIVNNQYIEKLARDFSGYYLKMRYFDENLSVSRPFLLQVKDSLSTVNTD